VALEFSEGNAAELTGALIAGRLDIALLRLPVSTPPGVEFVSLLDEEMLMVLPHGHAALASARPGAVPTVSLKALKDEPFILVRRGGAPGMYANLVAACERNGYTPRIAIEVDRMLTNISLVAAGAGVSAVPASMQGFHLDQVTYCRIRDGGPELRAPLTLACREGALSPAASHFLALARRSVKSARRN
jgi:DNA-binding transcriptional LysR family regulator